MQFEGAAVAKPATNEDERIAKVTNDFIFASIKDWCVAYFNFKTRLSYCAATIKKPASLQAFCVLVARGGIEPPTRGFSVRCSTN